MLFQATVLSCLDDSLLVGRPALVKCPPQIIPDASALLIFKLPKCSHINSPVEDAEQAPPVLPLKRSIRLDALAFVHTLYCVHGPRATDREVNIWALAITRARAKAKAKAL